MSKITIKRHVNKRHSNKRRTNKRRSCKRRSCKRHVNKRSYRKKKRVLLFVSPENVPSQSIIVNQTQEGNMIPGLRKM